MSQHSTHFLFNIQAFSPLNLRLAKTTPLPTSPLWKEKFSLPVKTIFLFNPTGSQRGRLKREWAARTLTAQRSPSTPIPHLYPPTDHQLSHVWKRRAEKELQRGEKGKSNHKQRNPHISHIIPAGESSCEPEFPWWFKHNRCRAAKAHQQRGQITLTHWTPQFI